MDINNPNRDLSDPNWISAGAAHSVRKAQIERRTRQIRNKPVEKKHVPDILVYWDPKVEFGIEYNVEVFSKNTPCENCEIMGSYVIRDDNNCCIGACRKCLDADKKTILKVVELPQIHSY